jgi:hypothetical protein
MVPDIDYKKTYIKPTSAEVCTTSISLVYLIIEQKLDY